jgi:hypothetical protein
MTLVVLLIGLNWMFWRKSPGCGLSCLMVRWYSAMPRMAYSSSWRYANNWGLYLKD